MSALLSYSYQYNQENNVTFFPKKIKNSDVAISNNYFDVLPAMQIYSLNLIPIFSVRLKSLGIMELINYYRSKYHINIILYPYKINTEDVMMCKTHAHKLFSQSTNFIEYLDFDTIKNGGFCGMIISITNKNGLLVHAIPIIIGKKHDGTKVSILLDAYSVYSNGTPDIDSGALICAKYIKENFSNQIEIYVQKDPIQADFHSCGVIALDIVKNFLVRSRKITRDTISSGNKCIITYPDGKEIEVINFEMQPEIKKFAQSYKLIDGISKTTHITKQNIVFHDYIDKNKMDVLYYKNVHYGYSPHEAILPIDEDELTRKTINAKILKKGHEYAKIIIQRLQEKSIILSQKYNPDYWLSIISRKNKGESSDFLKFIKKVKPYRN